MNNILNKICQKVAHRIPMRLRYFICIDGWAKATTGQYGNTNACELTADEMVRRLGQY